MITEERLRRFAPASVDYEYGLAKASRLFHIATHLQVCHWLAQIAHESGGFKRVRENLNYSVEALLSLFGRHRITQEEAELFGRSRLHPADQRGIANCLYGGPWGAKNLGNVESDDGARFIGRGLKQTTGRANYRKASIAIYGDERLLDKPELLEQPEPAALSAGYFWHSNNLNPLADRDDLRGITRVVNGGTLGLAERAEWLEKAKGIFK